MNDHETLKYIMARVETFRNNEATSIRYLYIPGHTSDNLVSPSAKKSKRAHHTLCETVNGYKCHKIS